MIKVNTPMLSNCSRGVRRYYSRVSEVLHDEKIPCSRFERFFKGFLTFDIKGGVLWSPGQGGTLISKKHIVTCHDVIDFTYYGGGVKNQIKKLIHSYIYQRALNIVFISDSTKLEFEKVFPNNSSRKTVIKSAVDMDLVFNFKVDVLIKNKLKANQYFILVTNAMPHKNNRIFIDAIQVLSKEGVSAVIVGDLSEEDKERTKKTANILHLNGLENDELFTLVKESRGLVSTSLVEGHNLTIAEALSLEKTVIASDIDVHREFYNGYCLFFNPNDNQSLAELLKEVYFDRIELPVYSKQDLKCWRAVGEEYKSLFHSYK
ncbi:glycosyltransferase [Pseudoalteromonas sp. CAL260-MNA-CIBAN-0059]|uniref:glycosyltransferase n=1 Tax=Pseudoalteromonas sp. CAL260-MNA-CIBAN-0059 TaxID=3140430 RepID=UPI003321BFA3